ncbi:MAG TPA: hypothetical protein VF407_06640 [Polyangiaceae bacterium]
MKRTRGLFAIALALTGGAFVACSLEDGGTLDLSGDHDAAPGTITDGGDEGTVAEAGDGGAPDAARALTFCDHVDASAPFFFCNDFDRDAAPPGETTLLSPDASIAFVDSDASAPHAFESSIANPLAGKLDVNGAIVDSFSFADSGATAPLSYVRIAFDLRVNALTYGTPGIPAPFVNTVILAYGEKFAFTAPIVDVAGKPVFSFDAIDVNDGGNTATMLGDGGITLGAWTHLSFDLEIDPDLDGIATLTRDGITGPPFAFRFTNDALVADRWHLLVGMSANGPVSAVYDVDNVVVTSDKR